MDHDVAAFISTMTFMALAAALLFAWIRSRAHARASDKGLEATRQVELLSNENAGLKGQVGPLLRRGEHRIGSSAQRTVAQDQGREQLRRFLTPGQGYQSTTVQMFH